MSRFRFISVYYGALLEPFLASGGEALESNKGLRNNHIEENKTDSRRKFDFYEVGLKN